MTELTISKPYCDWLSVAFKDKRRGKMWSCQACGHRGKGKQVPACPCEQIEVSILSSLSGDERNG